MTPETEKQIYEAFRGAVRDLTTQIFEPVEKMTDWPGGQAVALREIEHACSPKTHRLSLRRLCEKFEDLIDGRVSGAITTRMARETDSLIEALEALQAAANGLASFLEPYAGVQGTLRLALETGTRPWNILLGLAGEHPFQLRRAELDSLNEKALDQFSDAFGAWMPAMESALSMHTGVHFSFREIYDSVIALDGGKSES